MDHGKKKSRLLFSAIGLLILFNGYQIYGIFFSSTPVQKYQPQHTAIDTSSAKIQINVLNGCGVSGVGTVMTDYCRKLGYDVVEMGNYKSFDVGHTLVIDRNGKSHDALRLAQRLGITSKNVIAQFNSDQLVSASIIIGKDYQLLTPWKK